MDADRILTSLNNAGITQKQPALYQAIKFLINATRANQGATTVIAGGGGGGGGGATANGTYLTATDETASLVNSRELLAGAGTSFDDAVAGQRTVNLVAPVRWVFQAYTNAQFKALPTTPLEIVPTPGAGKCLVPLWGMIQVFANVAYTNVDPSDSSGLSIAYGNFAFDCFNFAVFTGVSTRILVTPQIKVPDATTLFAGYPSYSSCFLAENYNLSFVSLNGSGNYTGGDVSNAAYAAVAYYILDFSTGEFS